MPRNHCLFSGCAKTVDLPEVVDLPPEGWRYIWTNGENPRIGFIQEGFYCEHHAEEIDRRIAQAHRPVAPQRRPR
jgi:hypothetical protein